ncbi:FAD-dependent oxidoreductase [Granulicella sp. L46]|uniref:FAD-dependent oxidoreductase n=1 Tax=Granulicella sp. L46 TaxID=1641865 RepID=UPI00131B1D58|nr:GMC family oxidoreductase [Granulicella sp. L46]
MEIDLATAEAPKEAVRSQVCVVGAGIAGLVLARRLALAGTDVVVLEAGGHSIEDSGQRLFARAELKGQAHVGTTEGRFRVFGGTSLRWGGQVLAMAEDGAEAWPVGAEELKPFVAEAEGLLEVGTLPFEGGEFFEAIGQPLPAMLEGLSGVEARVSKWMAFPRRNLAPSLGKDLLERARVYLHAQVVELLLAAEGGRIETVVVRTPAGKMVRFEADEVVLAAGTVEASRLLLASGLGNEHDQVGRNFHDHVTLPAATLTGAARARVVRELRPWVFFTGGATDMRGGTLHSVKLEASQELRERLGLNPILAHLAIVEPEGSGIAVVREMLTSLQRGELAKALTTHALKIPGAMLDGARLVLGAKLRGRRFISDGAAVKLQFNLAQDRPSCSRVMLADGRGDTGMPEVVVDWRVSEQEVGTMRKYAAHLKEQFEAMGLTGVEWAPGILGDGALEGLEDARHAMGGACMGTDPRTSVVDAEMKVHGVENLSIASAAVFPDGSAQLPTLTMMALALRLAERLAAGLA